MQFIILILGLLCIVGGIADVAGNLVGQIVMIVAGLALTIVGGYFALYKIFYKIASDNEAIIRTGGLGKGKGDGGDKPDIFKRRGAWVIPLIHKHRVLKFEQQVLEVKKAGETALVCADFILVDILATFKISINDDEESIIKFVNAAGSRNINDMETYRVLAYDTLETALRDACTQKEFDDIFKGREDVANEIENSVASDFETIGLRLDIAKLRDVDPTAESFYRIDNHQHATGKAKVVKVIEDQKLEVERKRFQTEKSIREEEVTKERQVLDLDQGLAEAAAEQRKSIRLKEIGAEEAAQNREIEMQEAIERRSVKKLQVLEVENQARLADELKRVQAEEEIKTVQAQEDASRQAKIKVINATAEADEQRVTKEKQADAEAYTIKVDALARKDAAENDASAIKTKANAEKDAAVAHAAGEKANAMIPVEVDRERVAVLERELEAKTKHSEAAIGFEVQKLEISKRAEVKVAFANAIGQFTQGADMKIYGSPEMLASVLGGLTRSFGYAETINGFVDNTDKGTMDSVKGGLSNIAGIVAKFAESLGQKVDPKMIETMIRAELDKQEAAYLEEPAEDTKEGSKRKSKKDSSES